MRAGALRFRVKIQTRSTTPDSYGEAADTWTTADSDIPASIEPLSAREMIGAQAVQSEITHRVRLRYRSGVLPSQRILYGSRIFDVKAVRNVGEYDRELELLCSEGVTQG